MEEKKQQKKLTLNVSGRKTYSPKTFPHRGQKKSFVIEKKVSRGFNQKKFYSGGTNFDRNKSKSNEKIGGRFRENFPSKNMQITCQQLINLFIIN